LTENDLFSNDSGFTIINTQVGKIPSALESSIHRKYTLVSTVHGSPDEHIVRDTDFGIIVGIATEFSRQILFDVLRCLDWIFTDLITTTVKQLKYITEHSSNIGTVNLLNYKQERLRSISPTVLEGFYIN